MKPEPYDPLLAAVLLDDPEFRAATLRQTVALAGRRRRLRYARRALGVGALLCAAAVLLRPRPSEPFHEAVIPASGAAIVRSAPSTTLQIVRTRKARLSGVTDVPGSLAIVTSRAGVVPVVETRRDVPKLDYLTDRQLLAAFPDRRAALIDPGTAKARVVFY
jgi:hypothetical protein